MQKSKKKKWRTLSRQYFIGRANIMDIFHALFCALCSSQWMLFTWYPAWTHSHDQPSTISLIILLQQDLVKVDAIFFAFSLLVYLNDTVARLLYARNYQALFL